MIRKTDIYEDEKGRQVTALVKWDDPSDVEYRGHGLVPVKALKQMVPFQFKIPDVDSVKEAYDKFDELFGNASAKALENIMEQIRKTSQKVVTPQEVKNGSMASIKTPNIGG